MAIDTQGNQVPSPATIAAAIGSDGHPLPYLECRDLFKIFKLADLEVVALRGVDLEVVPGEVTAIVGASGSGKTTLLNILAGLERPSAGQVRVGERDLLNISDRELVIYRRQEVGFVWQSTSRNLVPYLNVRDNIELPMAIARVPKSQRRQRSGELLEAMHMEDKAQRFPDQLSGGEQQRVAIGVALANRPPLLLADEPTGELDTQMADEIFDLLREMNRALGVTVLVVTHYPGVARHVNRVVHIRDGRISAESFMQTTYRRRGDLVQQEYLVVDRVGRLQLPPDQVEQLRRNGLAGLAAADYLEGRVTISPAGRPDSAPVPVQPQQDPVPPPVQEVRQQSEPELAAVVEVEAPTVVEADAPAAVEAEAAVVVEAEAPAPDPHAMFRRPQQETQKGD
ncbi:MAG: ABC transporter ATP-binding protein [Chloroflexi bacterium]|nr:ABC transporter ATP-binding protein [Chloroflexota bacterium]